MGYFQQRLGLACQRITQTMDMLGEGIGRERVGEEEAHIVGLVAGLRGNHDEAWLETWNGSAFTRCPHIPGARPIWDQYQGLVPPAIGEFLAGSRLTYEDGYAWYAHAGAQPGIPFWETPPEVYLWGTEGFLTSSYDWGKPIIFGHYELEEPLLTPTKMGLDTAAWRSGVLTALHVETRTIIQATKTSRISTATSPLRE